MEIILVSSCTANRFSCIQPFCLRRVPPVLSVSSELALGSSPLTPVLHPHGHSRPTKTPLWEARLPVTGVRFRMRKAPAWWAVAGLRVGASALRAASPSLSCCVIQTPASAQAGKTNSVCPLPSRTHLLTAQGLTQVERSPVLSDLHFHGLCWVCRLNRHWASCLLTRHTP